MSQRSCKVEGCESPIKSKVHCLCNAHYIRFRRYGNAEAGGEYRPYTGIQVGDGFCISEGCNFPIHNKKRQLCRRCYFYWRNHENPDGKRCSIDGCNKPHSRKGYCSGHAHRLERHGDPLKQIGRGNPGKRRGILKFSGEHITSSGYKKIRVEDGDKKVRWILEHRYVMEQVLGRELYFNENVHHKDGNKLNNDPENLELWIKPQPHGIRVEDAIKWAEEIIHRYKK